MMAIMIAMMVIMIMMMRSDGDDNNEYIHTAPPTLRRPPHDIRIELYNWF